MGPSHSPAANVCYHSSKGKNTWRWFREHLGCPSHHRSRLHRPRGEGRLHLSKGEATAEVLTCLAATTQSLGGLGSRATAPMHPEGGASSQKVSSAVLVSNGIFLTGFGTYLVDITPFFFPIPPFWNGNVYPMGVLSLYGSIFLFHGFRAGEAGELDLKSHPYPI